MLKLLQKLKLRKTGKTTLSSQATSEEHQLSGSYQKENTTETTLNLYDIPSKINVETFYRIMETGDLTLLMVNQSQFQNLNSDQQESANEKLNDVWLDLQEYYYSHTSKQSFEKFKYNLKKVVQLQNEITTCEAALQLVVLGFDEHFETLIQFGITATDIDQIKSAISRKETKLEFAKNKLEKGGEKESAGFYKLVANVERALNRQLDLREINLERWVAYLQDIKERNEQQKQEINNSKRKRKWRDN